MRSYRRSDMFGVALVAAILGALVVSVLPALAAQVGDPLRLGGVNKVDERTDLKGKAKGANLQIKNTGNARALSVKADKIPLLAKSTKGPVAISAKASRNAIKIRVDAGQAPLKVNPSAGTATNLSADLLDGMDSTAFLQPSGLVAAHVGGFFSELVSDDEVVRSLTLRAPADGVIIAISSAFVFEQDVGADINCSITTGLVIESGFTQKWESSGSNDGQYGQLSGTRGFDVTAGQEVDINLVCESFVGSVINDPALTAIFIPGP
jgi:hypothetical protein